MGHLYHGYVSHNQRVIFFCVCVHTAGWPKTLAISPGRCRSVYGQAVALRTDRVSARVTCLHIANWKMAHGNS